MACSLCKGFGHYRTAHLQTCVVCGGDATVVRDMEKVDRDYRCRDEQMHQRVKQGFGDVGLLQMRDDRERQTRAT